MSLKKIAREAGVSTATVSHVINKSKHVTEPTREKVLRAVEKFNFYPNHYAQMLALGKSNVVGLVVSDISNPFFSEIIQAVEAVVREAGYNLVLLNSNYDPQRAVEFVYRLLQMKAAGVVLMCSEFDAGLLEIAQSQKTNFVFYNPVSSIQKMTSIRVDYKAGIDEAVRHLVALGHQKIVHISGPKNVNSAKIRRRAFADSVKKYLTKSSKVQIYEGNFRFEGGCFAAREILQQKELPTAIVVANDYMALGAMAEFKKAGLLIPQDISIVGFDDIALASISEPALTTISSRPGEIGRIAIETLMQDIENPNRTGNEIRLPTYFVERASTGAPREDK